MIEKLRKHRFLFEELVKRDFKKKYKRTILGMAWSVLSPLLQLLVLTLVFTQFFGRTTPHFMIYIFCGNLVFSFFSDATKGGMGAIMGAKKVLLAASGAEKADAILGSICGAITPHCPGSILQLHPNVAVVVDEAAGSKLKAAGVSVCG